MSGQPLGGAGLVIASAAELAALTPTDGQIIAFQDPTTLVDGTSTMRQLGVRWLLQYDGRSSSGSKWEYVGGPPLYKAVDADELTTSTTYVDLTTVGPSITVPLAGDYILTWRCECYSSGGVSPMWMSPNANTTDESVVSSNVTDNTHQQIRTVLKTGVSASTLFKCQYKKGVGGTSVNFRKRTLEILPVRVG